MGRENDGASAGAAQASARVKQESSQLSEDKFRELDVRVLEWLKILGLGDGPGIV